jgi:hypothetical protein
MGSQDYRKQVEDIVSYLAGLGYVIVKNNNNHYKISDPIVGNSVYMGSTPSDPRAIANFVACLKREFGRKELPELLKDSKKMKRALKEARK